MPETSVIIGTSLAVNVFLSGPLQGVERRRAWGIGMGQSEDRSPLRWELWGIRT